jgi:hypothetical protein
MDFPIFDFSVHEIIQSDIFVKIIHVVAFS